MLNLPDEIILSILSYLTLYQTYNVRLCCKQLFSLLLCNASSRDCNLWKEIIRRDFCIPDSLFYSHNFLPYILILDTFDQRFNGNEYVSKRFLKQKFFLREKEIQQLSFCKIGSNRFAYLIKDVIKLVCKIHIGITNFHIYYDKMMLDTKKKREELKKQFYIWRIKEDKKSLVFSSLTSDERYEIIQETLNKMGKSFINGTCIKSLEEIKSLISMSYYLHSYNRKMFIFCHEKFKYSMETIMFKNRENKNFDWMDAFFTVKKKYDKKFLFI